MPETSSGAPEKYETLPRAPITEAVIDFRVGLASGAEPLASLEEMAKTQRDRYAHIGTQNLFQGTFRFDDDGLHPGGGSEVIGFRLQDEHNLWVAQLQVGGLTVSRLKPYETWETLFDEAWRLWEIYREVVDPESVTRLATRYLNHIPLPVSYRVNDYFVTPVQVPEGLPEVLAAFNQQLILDAGDDVRANVTLRSEPVETGAENSTILFDIDCYRLHGLLADDSNIPSFLGNLRELKNRIFFKSLTEKALDLFR